MKKKTSLLLLCITLLAATFQVYAGSFSRGGGSFSRGSSFSSNPARSIGMSRPSMAPAPRPSIAPPRPSTSPSYAPAPRYATGGRTTIVNNHSGGGFGGGGGGFMSSLAGGFAGSALGNLLTQPPHTGAVVGAAPMVMAPAQGAGVPVDGVGYSAAATAAPMYVSQAPAKPSVGSSILWFIVQLIFGVILLGFLGWLIWTAYSYVKAVCAEAAVADSDPEALPFSPVEKFVAVQKAYAARDVQTLRALLGADLAPTLEDLPPEGSEYTLKNITYEVAYSSGHSITIRFTADDTADDTKLNEVWLFRRQGPTWVVNGIAQ